MRHGGGEWLHRRLLNKKKIIKKFFAEKNGETVVENKCGCVVPK